MKYPDHIQAFFDLYNAMANLYHELPFGSDCDLTGLYEPDQVAAIERGRKQLHRATKTRDEIKKAWAQAEKDAADDKAGRVLQQVAPENAGMMADAIRKGIVKAEPSMSEVFRARRAADDRKKGCNCPDGLPRNPECPIHGSRK